jgi:hypothetical protein
MVIVLYVETLEQLQRTTRLKPESRNYTNVAQVAVFFPADYRLIGTILYRFLLLLVCTNIDVYINGKLLY